MIFSAMIISSLDLKRREGKSRRDDTLLTGGFNSRSGDAARTTQSRRDDTLLTVDFNLRKLKNGYALQSPAGTTLCRSTQVSSLRDLSACVAYFDSVK